ncbi:ferredoxin--NADP reductase [Marinobacterium sedimentorum]|uniref:ferredoxin--NADP reductase n=1 Tax=Marinobacterium sedimentorum TaxID=2927804 RepID=UPI0020C5FCD6|nr:ferredoxin--NADP reductase [Marinobacterium sedimentorum]MCP8687409.1 ferredoxin--NADP reductase [Marinobacterium sedimentorum]
MSNHNRETVTAVHHWNETLFSFTTTRDPGFRFKNGHFTMIGLELEGRPLMRAYSIASANYEDEMEFFSIKVQDGPLTSHLQRLQVGDEVLISRKPTGTLVADHLLPGRNLYLLSTGTGLAPFMSIIRDPEIYERFDRVILTHGVRSVSELAYQQTILEELPNNEFFGEEIREKLLYYPTVTREAFRNQGRLTDLMRSGKLFSDLGLPQPNLEDDRFMICGSPSMLKETCDILNDWGFSESRHGEQSHYVIERAFVEK